MAGQTNVRPELNPSARSSARLGLGEVDVIAPGLMHVRFAGAIRPEHIESLMRVGDEQLAMGHRLLIAIDADDVHGYKTEVRQIIQGWLRQNRASIEKVWVLFRSPLIKMGFGLANAFTGGMLRAFDDPEEFDAELSKATTKAQAGWLIKNASEARH